jgi:hypothetical protein
MFGTCVVCIVIFLWYLIGVCRSMAWQCRCGEVRQPLDFLCLDCGAAQPYAASTQANMQPIWPLPPELPPPNMAQTTWLSGMVARAEQLLRVEPMSSSAMPAVHSMPVLGATPVTPVRTSLDVGIRPAIVSPLDMLASAVTPVQPSPPFHTQMEGVSPLDMLSNAIANASPIKGRDPMLLEDDIGSKHIRDDVQPTRLLMEFQSVSVALDLTVCGYTTRGGKVCKTPAGTCLVASAFDLIKGVINLVLLIFLSDIGPSCQSCHRASTTKAIASWLTTTIRVSH